MPNPIKASIRIAGPLTERHFGVLGQVVASWNDVELRIAYLVAAVSNARLRSVLFAFQNMTVRAKLDTAYATLEIELFQRYDGLREEVLPLLDKAKKLSAVRHAAAHSVWLGLTARGHMVAVDIEARRERAYIGRVSWSIEEFETVVSRLDDLTTKLQNAWDSNQFLPDEAIDIFVEPLDFSGPDFS